MSDIPNSRIILNSLETSVRNLTDLNEEINFYRTLLINITFESQINCEFLFLENLKAMLRAYESFSNNKFCSWEISKDPLFTEHSLLTHAQEIEKSFKTNSRPGNCVYRDNRHIFSHDVIANIETRKNLLKNQGRCFICLSKGHVSKTCKENYSCVKWVFAQQKMIRRDIYFIAPKKMFYVLNFIVFRTIQWRLIQLCYVRVITKNGIFVNLLCGEAKVTPLKKISIRRLELLSCLWLAKYKYLQSQVRILILPVFWQLLLRSGKLSGIC